MNFHENPSSGSRVVACGRAGGRIRTDRHSKANSFLSLRKRLKTNQLALFRKVIALCSEIHPKHINTLYGQEVEFVFTVELNSI